MQRKSLNEGSPLNLFPQSSGNPAKEAGELQEPEWIEGTRRQGPETKIMKVLISISSKTLKQQLESRKKFVPGPLHIFDDFQL